MDGRLHGRKRHSPEWIATVLRRVEAGIPIAELARKNWSSREHDPSLEKEVRQLGVAEIREINELRAENTRLERLVADLTIDKVVLQDVFSKKL